MANVPRSARGAAHSCRDRIRLRRCAQAAMALATEEAGGNIGADHRFDTHSPVVPRAGGRLHDPDDAQVARHDMDRPLPQARRGATRATLTRLCVKRKLRGPPRTTARVVPVRGSGSLESPGGVRISGHRSVVVRLDPALAPQRRRLFATAPQCQRSSSARCQCCQCSVPLRRMDWPRSRLSRAIRPPSPVARRLAFCGEAVTPARVPHRETSATNCGRPFARP